MKAISFAIELIVIIIIIMTLPVLILLAALHKLGIWHGEDDD